MADEPEGPRKRRYGEGTIYYSTEREAWVGVVPRKDGRRKKYQNRDWREVEQWMDSFLVVSKRPRNTDGLRAHTRRARALSWTAFLVEEADREEWADEFTARVIVAQLSIRRIRANIFGPCDYCGTWVADTVDHVIPRFNGGTDERSNLVSACWSCNSSKGIRHAPGTPRYSRLFPEPRRRVA